MRETGRVIGALLLGAAAGAAIGLLLAPEKGKDMRKKIMDAGDDLVDELAGKVKEGKKVLTDLMDKAMNKAVEKSDELAVETDSQMGYGSKYQNGSGTNTNRNL